MSGAEFLAIAGGIAALTGLSKHAQEIISWIRSGPGGEQLSLEAKGLELRCLLLAELEKLNGDVRSEALKIAIESVACQLQEFQELISLEDSFKHAKRRDRARHAFKQPERTQKLRNRLLALDSSLDLICKIILTSSISPASPVIQSPNPEPVTALTGYRPLSRFFRQSYISDCSRGTCICICHYTKKDLYRNQRIEGSPWTSLFANCGCKAKSFSWTITAFQKQVSLIISLAYEQSFSICPALRICNTVPNTSPLFVILHKCQTGFMEFDEAMSNIQNIISSGLGRLHDMNRNGENWFEVLLRFPWDFSSRHTQFALLDYFMAEGTSVDSEKCVWPKFQPTLLTKDRLLLRAVRWIGEGPHMDLLETILPPNGNNALMHPAKAHAVLFQSWPRSFDPNWICLRSTRDPFFIEVMSLFVNHDPDFGNTGPLQHEIHIGNLDSVRDLLHRKDPTHLMEEKNFLQQSPLHISVQKPKILELLLTSGFAKVIDVGDREGTTPLMYAAAYGEASSVIELLRAGADTSLLNQRQQTFLDHALERSRFDLLEAIFNFYHAEGLLDVAQLILDATLHRYVWRGNRSGDPSLLGLRRLLELGARPRWVTDNGNTLFHAVNSVDMVDLLLEFCLSIDMSQNNIGRTPLMLMTYFLDVDLMKRLPSDEASIRQQDCLGWTVFEHLFRWHGSRCGFMLFSPRYFSYKRIPLFQIAFHLLRAGADFGSSDRCVCPCSSQGCTALQFFLPGLISQKRTRYNVQGIPWLIELFLLLRAFHKPGLQILIQSLRRRQRFDELGLTHTCCFESKHSGISSLSCSSPIEEAIEIECPRSSAKPPIDVDREDLRVEQEELVEILERDCGQCQIQSKDYESIFITTLARRIVFLERGLDEIANHLEKRRQQYGKKVHKSCSQMYSNKIEILWPSPNEHVIDYGKDEFIQIFGPIDFQDESFPCTEELVNEYLQIAQKLDYQSLPLIESNHNGNLHQERQRMCEQLIQTVMDVRKMSDEDADWTLDIVGDANNL